jgi:hypothetical protein
MRNINSPDTQAYQCPQITPGQLVILRAMRWPDRYFLIYAPFIASHCHALAHLCIALHLYGCQLIPISRHNVDPSATSAAHWQHPLVCSIWDNGTIPPAAGDEDAEDVEAVQADEYDAVFGGGHDLMDVDFPALSAREQTLLKKLNEGLADIKFETCDYCLEESFSMQVDHGMCAACKRDNGDPVRKWSAKNGVHPGIYYFSAVNVNSLTECHALALNISRCLKGLTDMEVARVKACMLVRWTKGRQLCYQDPVVNFRQDIAEIATKLPRLLTSLSFGKRM